MLYILSTALQIHCKHSPSLPSVIISIKIFVIPQKEIHNQQLLKPTERNQCGSRSYFHL